MAIIKKGSNVLFGSEFAIVTNLDSNKATIKFRDRNQTIKQVDIKDLQNIDEVKTMKKSELKKLIETTIQKILVNETLSKMPYSKSDDINTDKQILRAAILAEIDAINLYEQLANNTKNKKIKTVLLDIAKEEKTHIGELQTLLLEIDPEQEQELKVGKREVNKLSKSEE